MKFSDEKKGYIMVFLAGATWGSVGMFMKFLKALGGSAELIGFVRLFLAFILILIFCLITSGKKSLKVSRKTLICCIFMGLFPQAIYNVTYAQAINRVGVAAGAVLLYTAPIFTAMLSGIIFREKFTHSKVIALLLNMLGCALAVTGGNLGNINISAFGILMGLTAAIMYSTAAIIGRFATDGGESPFTIAIYTFLFAFIFTGILAKPWTEIATLTNPKFLMVAVLYALIPTVAGYVIFYKGIAYVSEASKIPVFSSIEVVVATCIGVLIFSEGITVIKALGIAIILISIYIMNLRKKRGNID